jgi:hypothetical protein
MAMTVASGRRSAAPGCPGSAAVAATGSFGFYADVKNIVYVPRGWHAGEEHRG